MFVKLITSSFFPQEYATALKYVRALLQVEPGNRQAQVSFPPWSCLFLILASLSYVSYDKLW